MNIHCVVNSTPKHIIGALRTLLILGFGIIVTTSLLAGWMAILCAWVLRAGNKLVDLSLAISAARYKAAVNRGQM